MNWNRTYEFPDQNDAAHAEPPLQEFLPGTTDAEILLPLADRIETKRSLRIGEATVVDMPLVSETERKFIVTALRHLAGATNAKEQPS